MKKLTFTLIKKPSRFSKITLTLALVILLLTNFKIKAQDELNVIWQKGYNQWIDFSDARNSLYHYLSGQVYDLLDKRVEQINKYSSLTDWQQRQKWLRETLLDIVGPFPERNPLNAKILRVIDKNSFRVEHIVFESQPGFYVTSSLFIPGGLKKKSRAPVVIYCSGHSVQGYHIAGAQNLILNLVNKGFMVFAIDPVGQGERIGYPDPKTGLSTLGGPTREHSYPGTQAIITGSSQARYMIWDGIRAVDYLLSRKDVDPARIGITGCSGGGTQTACIAAMDDRIFAAVPQCYITSYTRLFQSIGPQDAEQNLFNEILKGIDHADLLSVRAPKPALVLSTTEDMFSIQGARETVKEVSRIYKAYDKEDCFGMAEDLGPHGSTKKTREAMYAFFQKHFNNPGNPVEEIVQPLTDEEIRVTSTGQLTTSLGGETVFSLNYREAEKLVNVLDASRGNPAGHMSEVLNSAKKLSGYREPSEINEPVFTGQVKREGYLIEKHFIKVEGNYIIPYLLFIPGKPANKALIYLHPSGKATEALAGGEIEWFVRNGFTVLAPDLIGLGEMGPGDFKGDAYIEGFSHNIWYASMLIGRSIVGIRAGDVVRLTRLLKKNSDITEIYGLARKEMAPVLLYAAAFDQSITRLALIEPYSSYRSIVMNRYYNSAFIHSTVPGALKSYDLPDLASSLAPRKLLMAGVTDGNGKSTDVESINKDLSVIRTGYQNKNAGNQLNIISGEITEKSYNLYVDWIK